MECIRSTFNGDGPLVVGIGRGTPGTVLFFDVHANPSIRANTVVAACLTGSRVHDVTQCFYGALTYHTMRCDAVNGMCALSRVIWTELCVRYKWTVCVCHI